jgi:hypothetical protein
MRSAVGAPVAIGVEEEAVDGVGADVEGASVPAGTVTLAVAGSAEVLSTAGVELVGTGVGVPEAGGATETPWSSCFD